MLKYIFTNGDVQNVNVTGDFFAVTLAPKEGKPIKLSPIEKAEDWGLDLAVARNSKLAQIELLYPNSGQPKIRYYNLVDSRELSEDDAAEDSPSYLRFIKERKREFKHVKFTQRTVWVF